MFYIYIKYTQSSFDKKTHIFLCGLLILLTNYAVINPPAAIAPVLRIVMLLTITPIPLIGST